MIDHRWDLSPREARALQTELAQQLTLRDDFDRLQTVAGVDVGFPRAASSRSGGITRAVVSVFSLDDLSLLDEAVAEIPTRFPYVPGLLSFREVPAILEALAALKQAPDLLLCDGQGRAHPRRLGLACHLGLLTDLPSIGVAKSRLVGEHAPLAEEKGAWQPLLDRGERVGSVLRSRRAVRPLYVSPGHRVGFDSSLSLTLRCLGRYRLPEPIRRADRQAGHRDRTQLRPARFAS